MQMLVIQIKHGLIIKDKSIMNGQKKQGDVSISFCQHLVPFALFLLFKSCISVPQPSLVNSSKYYRSNMVHFDRQTPKLIHDNTLLTMWSLGTIKS